MAAIAMVPVPALELMRNSNDKPLSFLGRTSLTLISQYLDDYGVGNEIELRSVAIVAGSVFLLIKLILNKRLGVDWYGFIHGIITGVGALVCIYLDSYVAESVTGTAEPMQSITHCSGPLTSLHRILPAITLGFSVLDLFDGLQMGIDFAIHGTATFLVMLYFNEVAGAPHIVAPMLVLECSTVFLYMMNATKEFPSAISVVFVLAFAVAFIIFRGVFFPYVHFRVMYAIFQNLSSPTYKECYPQSFVYVCGIFGMIFHCLNVFWLSKIISKFLRKMRGLEKFAEKNELHNFKNSLEEETKNKEMRNCYTNGTSHHIESCVTGQLANGNSNGYHEVKKNK